MELSRVSSKGQVTIPKTIRDLLKLHEGDRVAFLEDEGKVVLTKASLVALSALQKSIREQADLDGISEEDVLKELERVRKEMLNERDK